VAKRIFHRKTLQKNNTKIKTLSALKIFGLLVSIFLIVAISIFIYFAKDLPRPERFTEQHLSQSTKIYDRTGGVLLYEIYGEEIASVVLQQRIDANCMLAGQMVEDDRVGQRNQHSVTTVPAFDARFFADTGTPLIGAGRRATGLGRSFTLPSNRIDIRAPAEQPAK